MFVEPTKNDVLFGKSNMCSQHPGNKHFYAIIQERAGSYVQSKKKEKSAIVKSIIDEITVWLGGRFLKRVPGPNGKDCWCDAGERNAREKVTHALRDIVCGLVEKDPSIAKTQSCVKRNRKKAKRVPTKRTRVRMLKLIPEESEPDSSCSSSSVSSRPESPPTPPVQPMLAAPVFELPESFHLPALSKQQDAVNDDASGEWTVYTQDPSPLQVFARKRFDNLRNSLPSFSSPLEVLQKWDRALSNPEVSLDTMLDAADSNQLNKIIETHAVVVTEKKKKNNGNNNQRSQNNQQGPVLTSETSSCNDQTVDDDDDDIIAMSPPEGYEEEQEDVENKCQAPMNTGSTPNAVRNLSSTVFPLCHKSQSVKNPVQSPETIDMAALAAAVSDESDLEYSSDAEMHESTDSLFFQDSVPALSQSSPVLDTMQIDVAILEEALLSGGDADCFDL